MAQDQFQPASTPSTHGLDALAEVGSQYAMQELQQGPNRAEPVHQLDRSNGRDGHLETSTEKSGAQETHDVEINGRNKSANGQIVRRRISRACDQCNQLRTKCDGKTPCAHCVEFGLTCEYARERKKRGKASRKDIEAQQASTGEDYSNSEAPEQHNANRARSKSNANNGSVESNDDIRGTKRKRTGGVSSPSQAIDPSATNANTSYPSDTNNGAVMVPPGHDQTMQDYVRPDPLPAQPPPISNLPIPRATSIGITDRATSVAMGDYGTLDDYHRSILHPAGAAGHNIFHSGASIVSNNILHGGAIPGYGETLFTSNSPNGQQGIHNTFRMTGSPLSGGYIGGSPGAGSPGWLSLPSPTAALYPSLQPSSATQPLRYPVLRPLLPHISAIIPITLACDLLELYFNSTCSTMMHAQSPYVLGYIFRKRSMLRQHDPRPCSPALLASMLWVAAQTSESAFLTSPPSARGKICQKLLELAVGLLKPLIHTAGESQSQHGNVINGVALGGFGVALPGRAHDTDNSSPGATGGLDDVVTYMHLATVVSASEYKAASLRWWNVAWSLARELKLGRELPANPDPNASVGINGDGRSGGNASEMNAPRRGIGTTAGFASEEEREERRRIWWILYIVDRHLALCYNRPLTLLDAECDGLLQPVAESRWQEGEFFPPKDHAQEIYFRTRGPAFECTGHTLFGFFLPIMTILGEIVDLHIAKNHPRFGMRFKNGTEWADQVTEITAQLDAYGRSLQAFAAANASTAASNDMTVSHDTTQNLVKDISPSALSGTPNSSRPRLSETVIQTKIVVAYGVHLMHTMHILLNGRWDPISLLDDDDLWISSPPFMSATAHAVSAAEAIEDILDYDPDISFMPFFFGIYLLQGSFLLLLIADKLRTDATPGVVKACETIVRAHEACVVTLNTEYQRNFRKVMRSALLQVRGRGTEDYGEQQLRRREVLSLYRWTGDGTGLAH